MKYPLFLFLLLLGGLLSSCGGDADEPTVCNLTLVANPPVAAQCGQPNGSVTLATSGEHGSLSYRIDGGAAQSSATFETLAPGTYTITAQDDAGCTATTSVTITDEEITFNVAAAFMPSPCNQSEGSISLDVSGGTAPYSFSLDSTNFASESTLSNLPPGEYTVIIRDAEGCMTDIEAQIPSGVSFDATIKDIISTNCAVTGCHVAGGRNPNFEVKNNIFANASRIRDRTAAKTMPPPNSGRSLTDEQIALIDCWVSDGAPDN